MNQLSLHRPFPCRANHRSAGFTLIELLITIGIIAVLAALLTPLVSSMQKKAGAAQCVSNLRQVYAYFIDDTQQNDEMPMAWNVDAPHEVNKSWLNGKVDELKKQKNNSYKAFGCPVQRKSLKLPSDDRTYSMNGHLVNASWNPPPGKLPRYQNPSKVAVFTDGGIRDGQYNSSVAVGNPPECIHVGRANIVFLDGHVAALSSSEIPNKITKETNDPGAAFWLGKPLL